MRYYFFIITLCIITLWWCLRESSNNETISLLDYKNSNTNLSSDKNKKYRIWIAFASGDISMTYRDQKSIMWSIQYPDQKDTIVTEWYGKWFIKNDKIYHIPWVYWSIILSGRNIIYYSWFSFLWPSIDSERDYTRSYVWPDKNYREELSFMNWNSHEYVIMTTFSQSIFSGQKLDIDNPSEFFCTINDDMNPIKKKEYKKIGRDNIYITYRDNGGNANKTTTICFMKKDNLYKLEWTDKEYRKDIINSFQFIN